MNRRNVLKVGVSAAILIPTKGIAECINAVCGPDDQPGLIGTDNRSPSLNPTFCTSDLAHDLMTLQLSEDGEWIRLRQFAWYYGLMYPNGSVEFYGTRVDNRRCWDRQNFHYGTRAVMWMNCVSRADRVTWTRYWFITRPIVDNGDDYVLELYHTEPASSYKDAPAPNTAPPFVRLIG